MRTPELNSTDRLFEENRPTLLNIAYGMTGTLGDARDVVQDAYLKWNRIDVEQVEHPKRYLKTVVSRLCIDRFRSARHRREEYIGPWLPEPVTEEHSPLEFVELNDRLTVALLHVLEHLTADQRAIFLLHDIFGYRFREVAELVDKNPAACRKAAQRARETIQSHKPATSPADGGNRELLERFLSALRERDMDRLRELLTEDVVMVSDGGGRVVAARKPVEGIDRVSRFLAGISKQKEGEADATLTRVNGQPGFKVFLDGRLHSIWTFALGGKKIRRIYAVLNPEKLAGKK